MNTFILGMASLLSAVAFSLLITAMVRWGKYADATTFAEAAIGVWIGALVLGLVGLIL
jgi:hypothetical protein